MRILFDTNVLVAAFITGGNCYEVIEHSTGEHELYYTDFIIEEFRRVLKKNFHFSDSSTDEFVRFIKKYFAKGENAKAVENVCRDTDDDQILADAVANNIEIIITGDKDLLTLKTYKIIKILSPADYWDL